MKWSVWESLRKSNANWTDSRKARMRATFMRSMWLVSGLALAGCRPQGKPVAITNRGTGLPPVNAPVTAMPKANALVTLIPTARLFEYTRWTPQRVALTFDAGSDNSAVRPILAELEKHHTRATFFLTGKFCESYPDSCRAIAEAGMEIGNHSYSHPSFLKRKDPQIVNQLERAELAITRACGRGAKPLFRFPYGDCNRRTRQTVANSGYQSIGWTLDSLDSVGKPKSAAFVAKRIVSKIKPGYITLMHVSYRNSAAALPQIFAYLDKQGLESVPVSELLLASSPKIDHAAPTSHPLKPALNLPGKNGFSQSALEGPIKQLH